MKELWKYRHVVWNFAISDLKIKYRNSVLGFLWTFLEPLLLLTVLYVVFTNIFNSNIEQFPLYILLGIILWNMFSRGTKTGIGSIVSRKTIITQIYIPKGLPALSSTITSTFMLMFELIVLGIFMIVFQFVPSWTMLILGFAILLEFILVFGLSLPLSVANVRYKDIAFIWQVIIQVGFFATPIFYKLDILPEMAQKILYFSPMVQIFNLAHDSVIYQKIPTTESFVMATILTLGIFVICYMIFWKLKDRVIEGM